MAKGWMKGILKAADIGLKSYVDQQNAKNQFKAALMQRQLENQLQRQHEKEMIPIKMDYERQRAAIPTFAQRQQMNAQNLLGEERERRIREAANVGVMPRGTIAGGQGGEWSNYKGQRVWSPVMTKAPEYSDRIVLGDKGYEREALKEPKTQKPIDAVLAKVAEGGVESLTPGQKVIFNIWAQNKKKGGNEGGMDFLEDASLGIETAPKVSPAGVSNPLVSSAFAEEDAQIAQIKQSLPEGQMLVRERSSRQTGTINTNEFDESIYEAL